MSEWTLRNVSEAALEQFGHIVVQSDSLAGVQRECRTSGKCSSSAGALTRPGQEEDVHLTKRARVSFRGTDRVSKAREEMEKKSHQCLCAAGSATLL